MSASTTHPSARPRNSTTHTRTHTLAPTWVRHHIESSDFLGTGHLSAWPRFWLWFHRRWASMRTTTVPWDRNLLGGETGTIRRTTVGVIRCQSSGRVVLHGRLRRVYPRHCWPLACLLPRRDR